MMRVLRGRGVWICETVSDYLSNEGVSAMWLCNEYARGCVINSRATGLRQEIPAAGRTNAHDPKDKLAP